MTFSEQRTTPYPDAPLYAVGDVHGRLDLLDRLLEAITADMEERFALDARIVLLGDLVDRGQDSRGVLARLMTLSCDAPDRVLCLMGNHEKMLLDFLHFPRERGNRWLRHGGTQTLASFGVKSGMAWASGARFVRLAEELRAAMGDALVNWIEGLPLYWRTGDVVCVHAAMDPAMPPNLQDARDMLWGTAAFVHRPRADGLWIVHGHEVVDRGHVEAGRIATDTEAHASGRLTAAAIFPGKPVRFLST
jgi:serine/threonine protein phosphatase 1